MPQAIENDIQQFVRLVSNATDAFTAALFLFDERGGARLKLAAYQSLSNAIIPEAEIPMGYGLVGWVAKNERSAHATNFARDTKTLKFYSKDEDIKSFAAAPLFDNNRVIGVLSIDSKKQYVFTDKMLKLLDEFAANLARVIVESRRRVSLGSEAEAFGGLFELTGKITACSKISELTNILRLGLPSVIPHDHLALAVKSAEDDGFHMIKAASTASAERGGVLPLTHFRLGWVIQQARPIQIPDLKGAAAFPGGEGYKSFIGAPMVIGEQVTGAIGLLSKKTGAFAAVDTKTLTMLAASLASAFTSLYLHNKNARFLYMDQLTRTPTHRYLQEGFETFKEEGAVAIVNLVGFTKINHDLGMSSGDGVIKELAVRLNKVVGEAGVVSRYYGDRFILALEKTPRGEAMEMIREVVEAVESTPFHCSGVDIYAAPSLGVAFSPDDGEEIEELIAKAQAASERAKSVPGMTVSLYGDPQTPWQGALRSVKRQ